MNFRKASSFFFPSFILLFIILFAACRHNGFQIEGELTNAKDSLIVLEKPDFTGNWVIVDSARIPASGKFTFKGEALQNPEIFRLSIGNRYVYLPIDSIETIAVKGNASDFGAKTVLTGSKDAEKMSKFETDLAASIPSLTTEKARSDFKRRLFSDYLQNNRGSIIGYYILTKTIDGKPLFNPIDPVDYKYFAAVATDFKMFAPDDPRTALMEEITIEAMKRRNSEKGLQRVIEAEELNLLEISLPDENGVDRKLSEVASHGRPTIVIFSLMNEPESPEVNRGIASLYNKFAGGVNIYHVSLDSDLHAWRQAAANLPWTTVIDMDGAQSANVRTYNVSRMPAFYIYDAAGNLVNSTTEIEKVPSLIP